MNYILRGDKEKISNTGSGYSISEYERVIYNAEVLELFRTFTSFSSL